MFDRWLLADLQQPLAAGLLGANIEIRRVHTDTRSMQAGDLFVALQGENFDGHEYLSAAEKAGAVAALVDTWQEDSDLPQLVVADTCKALGQLGQLNRQRFKGKLVALTGSSGKTTVKEMLASIGRMALGAGAVLATRGNLNNELGVPMTLLELNAEHRLAIIELGASHPGEIAYTRSLAQPQVVLINNAGMAHAGEFGGPEQVVQAKGEILDELPEQSVAVLNLEDAAFDCWSQRSSAKRMVSFAKTDARADFYARALTRHADGCYSFLLCTPDGEAPVHLQLPGEHNVGNAVAAAAVAAMLDFSLHETVQGLEGMVPVDGRCVRHELGLDSFLIDDSYNANPASMRAAMDLLATMPGRRVLLLGAMGELGDWAAQEHRQLGEYANGKADELYTVGEPMQQAVAAFAGVARHFASQQQLIEFVLDSKKGSTSYLVKGSRSAAMERVAKALIDMYKGGY